MTHKDKELVIAALEEYKGDSVGLIAATVEDCQRVVREMAVEDGWIPVSERLPEINDDVLVCTAEGYVGADFICQEGNWFWNEEFPPTHWRPLPEPPREGV